MRHYCSYGYSAATFIPLCSRAAIREVIRRMPAVARIAGSRHSNAGIWGETRMAAISFEHADDVRAALREIVAHYGADTLSDPAAMSNLLKDLLPDDPRVARLLVAAAEDHSADVLRDHLAQGLDGATAARLAASTLA